MRKKTCLSCLAMVFLAMILLWRLLSPSDWVEVATGPLPKDTVRYCVLINNKKNEILSLYYAKIVPIIVPPVYEGQLAPGFVLDANNFVKEDLEWKEADQYGILFLRQNGQWQLLWLEPQEVVHPSWLRFIVGGGGFFSKATMNVPTDGKRFEVPSKEFLARLGINQKQNLPKN